MPSYQMRELTNSEKKLFDCFIKGYIAGIIYIPPTTWTDIPDEDIAKRYKKAIGVLHRRKCRFDEFKSGFFDGYFRSISYDGELKKINPQFNRDIYEYIKSLWLYHKVYGATETSDK